jgi:hypothetical protein
VFIEFANGAVRVLFAPVLGIELPVVNLVKSYGYKGITNTPSCASIPRMHLFRAGEPLLRQCPDIVMLMQRQH